MLNEAISDDLDIGIGDISNYELPKQTFTPIPKGGYNVRLKDWTEDVDRNTGALRTPYGIVATFVVVDGPHENRLLTYQRIKDLKFKSRPGASMLNDCLAALAKATNHEGSVKGRTEVAKLLDVARDTNATFRVRVDWESFDSAYIKSIKEDGRTPTSDDYNTARIKGQKNFNEDGTVIGPSGNTLTAQGVVTGFGS